MNIGIGTLIGHEDTLWRIVKITKKRLYVVKAVHHNCPGMPYIGSSVNGWKEKYFTWDSSHWHSPEVQTFENKDEWLDMLDSLKPCMDAAADASIAARDASKALRDAARTYGRIVTIRD